jgi:hypothetical protein
MAARTATVPMFSVGERERRRAEKRKSAFLEESLGNQMVTGFVRASIRLAPLAALLVGCGDEESPLVVYEDTGELCMFAEAPLHANVPAFHSIEELSFEQGSRLHITVAAPECLSSSCDVIHEASCSVAREGNELRVTSRLSFEPTGETLCTLDCLQLMARCESEPLEQGSYTVVLGSDERTLSVPSTLSHACQ